MKKISVLLIVLLALLVVTGAALADNGGTPRTTSLSGAEEVSGGDPDGSGWAMITLNHGQGMVCWEIAFEGIDTPFAAHIHSAVAGVNGPVVVPLFNPSINSGCGEVDPDLIKAIIQNPENYYVNVHNALYPGGALRGQLSVPGLSD